MHRVLPLFLMVALAMASSDPAHAEDRVIETRSGPVMVETFARGLDQPWGMAFLPDGRMLVTEIVGNLRIVTPDGRVSAPVEGVPEVQYGGQGGLLDVALDPAFPDNGLIYLTYADSYDGGSGTAAARGRFNGERLTDVELIFRQQPAVSGSLHFGSRLAFARDGTLFITTGERFEFEPAQDLGSHLGKVIRINSDGTVPGDNPFIGQDGVLPEIWSYGHRNVQGADIHPETGVLWTGEFGPRGGDEVNITEAGKNYGWPLVSWGRHYSMVDIPDPPTRPDLEPPVFHWDPAISPSGMSFYTGELFPQWQGHLFLGGLSSESLIRVGVEGNRITDEERLVMEARIRDVRQGPDGALYLLTDDPEGEIWRLSPRIAQ